MMSSKEQETTQQIPQYYQISCQQCRKSHLKCDRLLPACSQCIKGCKTCEYVPPKKRKPKSALSSGNGSSSSGGSSKSNKKRKVAPEDETLDVPEVPVESSELINFFYDELNSGWEVLPRDEVHKAIRSTSSKKRNDTLEYRVSKALWCSIQLVSLQHITQKPSADQNQSDHKQKVKVIVTQLCKIVESILLQPDIHREIAKNLNLAWAAANLATYAMCFKDKLIDVRIWLSCIKVHIDTQHYMHDQLSEQFHALALTYNFLKFVLQFNFPKNNQATWESMLKIFKVLYRLIEDLRQCAPQTDASFIPEALHRIRLSLEKRLHSGYDNLQSMYQILAEFAGIIADPSGIPLTKPSEFVFWKVAAHGFRLDAVLVEEAGLPVDCSPAVREELNKLKRSIADDLTSAMLEGSQAFFVGGVMVMRPLIIAATLHYKSANQLEVDSTILPFLQADAWLIESLQLKYDLPSEILTLLFDIKQKITAMSLAQRLKPTSTSPDQSNPSLFVGSLPDLLQPLSNQKRMMEDSGSAANMQNQRLSFLGISQPSISDLQMDDAVISQILSDLAPNSPLGHDQLFDTFFHM